MSETAQPAPEPDEKKSRGLGSYVLWASVAVMVYVLSSGPVSRLVEHKPAHEITGMLYWPLVLAYVHTPLRRPLGMYWHFWFPLNYDSRGNRIHPD